jgi:hypothetical protein
LSVLDATQVFQSSQHTRRFMLRDVSAAAMPDGGIMTLRTRCTDRYQARGDQKLNGYTSDQRDCIRGHQRARGAFCQQARALEARATKK